MIEEQVVTVCHEFSILVNAQISYIISRLARFSIERGGKVIGTKADVMRRSTGINNRPLSIGKCLVEGKACEAISKAYQRRREETARRAARRETMPLLNNSSH